MGRLSYQARACRMHDRLPGRGPALARAAGCRQMRPTPPRMSLHQYANRTPFRENRALAACPAQTVGFYAPSHRLVPSRDAEGSSQELERTQYRAASIDPAIEVSARPDDAVRRSGPDTGIIEPVLNSDPV